KSARVRAHRRRRTYVPSQSEQYRVREGVFTMDLPLKGIKVIDYTGVQSGPSCTQLMAWLGADVLKVERMHTGDNTRIQLRDIPNADALYFTMVNSNKRSLEIDTKTPEGKAILEELIRRSDVMVEHMAPGALDRHGSTWD